MGRDELAVDDALSDYERHVRATGLRASFLAGVRVGLSEAASQVIEQGVDLLELRFDLAPVEDAPGDRLAFGR